MNLAIRDHAVAARFENDMKLDLEQSRRVSLEEWNHRPLTERATELGMGLVLSDNNERRIGSLSNCLYNTHKCRGIHGTISPERVIRVIEELDADILCLQEIVDAKGGTGKYDQARRIAEAFLN